MSILPAAATRTGKEAHKGAGNMDGSRWCEHDRAGCNFVPGLFVVICVWL